MPSTNASPSLVGTLTATDIDIARTVLDAAKLVDDNTRFAYLGLEEPDKRAVMAGLPVRRDVRALLLDIVTGEAQDARISIDDRAVTSLIEVDGSAGQLPILDEEFAVIDDILLNDPSWVAALAVRGVDPTTVALAPLSAGNFGFSDEAGRRIIRVLAFVQNFETDHCWAHPVDGLCAYVDMNERALFKLIDEKVYDVPQGNGNFTDPELAGDPLDSLKPIEITQPEGPSFTVENGRVRWANWSLDVEFDAREGLVLRNIGFRDREELRSVIYRASIAEMVVPYGDPSPVRFWQNYFDTGEYIFGRYANSLTLGCDCLGEIHYFDATLADDLGNPRVISNAICMHEEDFGTLWKHTDLYTGVKEVRRQRRLVISFFTTVGNYDYGFYWYLYLDGTIECEAKLTGMLFTSNYGLDNAAYASDLGSGLGAPYHQHLFSARLDMAIDGLSNAVDEVDAVRLPMGPENPWGNAFTNSATRLSTEASASRLAETSVARAWHVVSTERTNHVGHPTGYALLPSPAPTLMADPASVIARRAAFTTKHLWVTRYEPDQRYAAGDLPNQSPGGGGLPAFIRQDRPIDGEDIVLWHTFGPTHFPRLEDWPVMPVDYASFTLKPFGFFDRNPALNIPAGQSHCAAEVPTHEDARDAHHSTGHCGTHASHEPA